MDKDFESSTKVPPHSLLAEQSVIGGLMHDSNVWDDLADRLIPEDFYRHEHRLIYEALSELAKRSQHRFWSIVRMTTASKARVLSRINGLLWCIHQFHSIRR